MSFDQSKHYDDKELIKVLAPSRGRLNEYGNPIRPTNARRLGNFLRKLGFTEVETNQGFHEASAFCKDNDGQIWYFDTGDDRWDRTLLMRTATSYTDFHGGCNLFPRDCEEIKLYARLG